MKLFTFQVTEKEGSVFIKPWWNWTFTVLIKSPKITPSKTESLFSNNFGIAWLRDSATADPLVGKTFSKINRILLDRPNLRRRIRSRTELKIGWSPRPEVGSRKQDFGWPLSNTGLTLIFLLVFIQFFKDENKRKEILIFLSQNCSTN